MDAKQCIILEIKKGDHTFSFSMPVGATFGTAIDAAFDILSHVRDLSTQAIEQAKQAQAPADSSLVAEPVVQTES
jgi:hypothetical protein